MEQKEKSFLEAVEHNCSVFYSNLEKMNGRKAKYKFYRDLYLMLNDQSQMQQYLDKVLNDICKHNVEAYLELIETVDYLRFNIRYVVEKELKHTAYDFVIDPESKKEFLQKFIDQMMYDWAEIPKYLTADEHKEVMDNIWYGGRKKHSKSRK